MTLKKSIQSSDITYYIKDFTIPWQMNSYDFLNRKTPTQTLFCKRFNFACAALKTNKIMLRI